VASDRPVTAADVGRWEQLAEAATPGPWDSIDGCTDEAEGNMCRHLGPTGKYPVLWAYGSNRVANVAFASASRQAVPALCRDWRRLDARVRELESLVASLSERCHKQSELLSKKAERATTPPEPGP
jgi:hypothetical protein